LHLVYFIAKKYSSHIVIDITTTVLLDVKSTERQGAIELAAPSLTEGELKTYPSYVSPWSLHVLPHQEIIKRVAQVDEETMRTVAREIYKLTRIL
jgi:hypothetical protein